VGLGREHRQAGSLKTRLRRCHCRALLRVLALRAFEVRIDTLAAAATAGGRPVVKMEPGA
jgi:hypothetical protein